MADAINALDTPGVGYSPDTSGLPLLGNALASAGQTAQGYLNALNRSVYLDPASRKAVGDALLGPQLNQTVGQVLNSPAANDAFGVAGGLGPAIGAIRAFHGSPYDFERFDPTKIGTGEGAQAYGHGMYFAENPQVAKDYQKQLAKNTYQTDAGLFDPYSRTNQSGLEHLNVRVAATKGIDEGIARAQELLQSQPQNADMLNRDLSKLMAAKSSGASPNPGRMYEVNINAEPEQFLDWDKPLNEQSDFVKNAISAVDPNAVVPPPKFSQIGDPSMRSLVRDALRQNDGRADGLELIIDNDSKLYNTAVQHAKKNGIDLDAKDMRASDYVYSQTQDFIDKLHASQVNTGEAVHRALANKGNDVMAQGPVAAQLQQAGVPGIKYLDQGSRGQTNWVARHSQGGTFESPNENEIKAFVKKNPEYSLEPPKQTSNYVVFDPKIVDIVKKYGIAGMAALPPATAAFLSERIIPVDHDPFENQ